MQQSAIKCRNRASQGLCGRADEKDFFLSRWRTKNEKSFVLKDGFRSREYVECPAARAVREVTSVVTICGYVSNNYWSSTANDSNNYYNVNFNSSCNTNNNNYNNNQYVKCVK